MKISCEVIRDLLPLYHDDICSDDSKALIEEHLAHCPDCTAELGAMDTKLPINVSEKNLHEAEAVKKLSRKWKKGMWLSVLKGAGLTILLVILMLLVLYLFVDFRIVTTP